MLDSHQEFLTAHGQGCSGGEVLFRTEPQRGYQRGPWSGIVAVNNSLPQGQAVVRTELSEQRAKKTKRPELEHLIDRVLVPILVARYVNRLKHLNLNSENAQ
jgi:hypothetical protein